jgi:hypothetical protein
MQIFRFLSTSAFVTGSIILVLFSSCGDLKQDLYLKADGSGRLETTMDIGELIGMAKSLENIGSDVDTFTDDFMIDTVVQAPDTSVKDPMQSYIEMITDPIHDKNVDTSFSLISIMPDSVRNKNSRPDLTSKMMVRLKSPANSGDLTVGIIMDFANTAELKDEIRLLQELNSSSNSISSTGLNMDTETFMSFETDMKEGWIRVDTVQYSDITSGFGMSQDSSTMIENDGMLEMMFGNSQIRSTIHVPGEVISCSYEGAILTKDNRVIVEQPFLEVIRRGHFDGFTIRFSPQK